MEPILKMEILQHLRAAILCLSALPANKKLPNMWLQLLMFQLTPTACNLGGGAQQQTLVTDWNTGGSCWTSGNISQLSTCSQHKPKPQPQHQSLWTKLSLLQPRMRALEQVSQDAVESPTLNRLQSELDTILDTWLLEQSGTKMMSRCAFQCQPFCDSVIIFSQSVSQRSSAPFTLHSATR